MFFLFVCLFVCFLFHFYCYQIFSKNLSRMIMWFGYHVVSSFFCCYEFNVSMFFYAFNGFSKTWIIYSFKKSFPKSFFAFILSYVFILIFDFNQAFCLNLVVLLFFAKTNPWFNACLGFLRPDVLDITILHFYHNLWCIYCQLLHIY